ncbi:MAG: flagellar basal body-associated FliL family protein [Proteobacteria bacterium]|nr:flagellar basal body-associated FliL family protein [Pseudomonadota bacterium]MBS0571879.1 flagellar basal body-associated FliL family protein [Pseudomonadota bacterium]
MTDAAEPLSETAAKRSKRPLLAGLLLMLLMAGAGFYAAHAGYLSGATERPPESGGQQGEGAEAMPDIAFVPIEPLVVSLGPDAGGRFLHFTAQLEVERKLAPDVSLLLPRIVDVLNGYLRAVETRQLADPSALVRLRSQMLRRIQLVTGDRVRDLLVSEFVIN